MNVNSNRIKNSYINSSKNSRIKQDKNLFTSTVKKIGFQSGHQSFELTHKSSNILYKSQFNQTIKSGSRLKT
jgi:hypothetical protein